MNQKKKEELAWAAGFFDGEGNLCTGTLNDKFKFMFLKLSLHQAGTLEEPPDTLLKFQKALDGLVSVKGPYLRKESPTRKPIWIARAQKHETVIKIIEMLWPWLGEAKRNQALDAMDKVKSYLNDPARRRVGNHYRYTEYGKPTKSGLSGI